MTAHWKFGEDFAIRYGGYRDIQWFKGTEYDRLAESFPTLSPNRSTIVNPVETIIDLSKSAGLFLQWWEMRQQTLLQSAAFEERRIGWIADILAQLSTELEQGTFRLDTIHYLDREISGFLTKMKKNQSIDAPSTLLLQIERSTNLFVKFNVTINNLLLEQSQNFTLPNKNIPQPFYYQPYFLLEQDEEQFSDYVDLVNDVLSKESLAMFSLGIAQTALSKGNWKTKALMAGLLWTVPKLLELRNKSKDDDRSQNLIVLQNFAIELRSTNALLRALQKLPPSLKVFNLEQIAGRSVPLLESETGKDG